MAQGGAVAGIDAGCTGRPVSGTVTDADGDPLAGIFIDFYTFDEDGFPIGEPTAAPPTKHGHVPRTSFIAAW